MSRNLGYSGTMQLLTPYSFMQYHICSHHWVTGLWATADSKNRYLFHSIAKNEQE